MISAARAAAGMAATTTTAGLRSRGSVDRRRRRGRGRRRTHMRAAARAAGRPAVIRLPARVRWRRRRCRADRRRCSRTFVAGTHRDRRHRMYGLRLVGARTRCGSRRRTGGLRRGAGGRHRDVLVRAHPHGNGGGTHRFSALEGARSARSWSGRCCRLRWSDHSGGHTLVRDPGPHGHRGDGMLGHLLRQTYFASRRSGIHWAPRAAPVAILRIGIESDRAVAHWDDMGSTRNRYHRRAEVRRRIVHRSDRRPVLPVTVGTPAPAVPADEVPAAIAIRHPTPGVG